jgi:hypothetical protein
MPAMTERLSLCNVRAIVIASPPKAGSQLKSSVIARLPVREASQSQNEIGFANTVRKLFGLRTEIGFANTVRKLFGLRTEIGFANTVRKLFGLRTEIGFANTFSNPLGWRTRSLRRYAPRDDKQPICHCEPSAPQKAWQSRLATPEGVAKCVDEVSLYLGGVT